MSKIKKFNDDLNKKFEVDVKISKAGGGWLVIPEENKIVDSKKMKEIKEYILLHSEELEDNEELYEEYV